MTFYLFLIGLDQSFWFLILIIPLKRNMFDFLCLFLQYFPFTCLINYCLSIAINISNNLSLNTYENK